MSLTILAGVAGLAAKGAIISWKTLALAAGTGLFGLSTTVSYKAGYKKGRIEQANTDSQKFRQMADDLVRMKKTYASAKEEWDNTLSYYEDYIEITKNKYNITPEEEEEIEAIINEYNTLRKLKEDTAKSEEVANYSIHDNPDFFIAAIILSDHYVNCDGFSTKEAKKIVSDFILKFTKGALGCENSSFSEKVTRKLSILKNTLPSSFDDITKYLDTVSIEELSLLNIHIDNIIAASGDATVNKKNEQKKFKNYIQKRKNENLYLVFDIKNDPDFALNNGISKSKYSSKFAKCHYFYHDRNSINEYRDIVFKKFREIDINYYVAYRRTFQNCVFEDCSMIFACGCTLINCTFIRCSAIVAEDSSLINCNFENCIAEEWLLFTSGKCVVDGCVFENISISDEYGTVCRMVADRITDIKYITYCSFINCKLPSDYCNFSECTYTSPNGEKECKKNLDRSCKVIS